MKKLLKNWGYFLIAFLLVTISNPEKVKAQVGVNISIQSFYDELSPYGQWIDDPEYGHVWVPNAEADFQPYATQGHWVVTQYGNTWVSDYPWGWAPFHYGRWRYDNYYGWQWIPGTEWGPAWVSWRNGGGYYGWAPLGPGVSVSLSFGSGYRVPNNFWVFVPQRYICEPRISSYYVPRRNNVTIINRTTIINNTYVNNNRTYIAGPRARDIERVTRTRVNVYNINNESRPGRTVVNNKAINIYRPEVSKTTSARPTKVVNANERPARDHNAVGNRPGNAASNNNRATENKNNVAPNAENKANSTRPARENTRPESKPNQGNRPNQPVEKREVPQNVTEPRVERPSRPEVNPHPAQAQPNNNNQAAAEQASRERASQQQAHERSQADQRPERPQAPAQPEQRTAPTQPERRVEPVQRPERPQAPAQPEQRTAPAQPERRVEPAQRPERPQAPARQAQPEQRTAPAPSQRRAEPAQRTARPAERTSNSRPSRERHE